MAPLGASGWNGRRAAPAEAVEAILAEGFHEGVLPFVGSSNFCSRLSRSINATESCRLRLQSILLTAAIMRESVER